MRKLLFIGMAAFALCACSTHEPRLVIIHTNDTHSHFEPVRGGDRDGLGGVVERAAFVDSIRSVYGEDKVLLLHAGDFSQGSSYFSELGGRMEIDMLNALRYDFTALGNHEFDNGIEALCERLKRLEGTRVICANLDLSPFELGKYVSPYAVTERGGMKIGLIGLEADLSSNVAKTISSRIPQLEAAPEVRKWEKYLHEVEKCDLIIVLSHLGYDEDKELAAQTDWTDLIIGGHTHMFVEDMAYVKNMKGRKVGVITDGCWGVEMGEVKIY